MRMNGEVVTKGIRGGRSRIAVAGTIFCLLGLSLVPTASATDMVACTIEDQYGQPLSGADVTVTNHATQDSTVISSDSNGDCTINAGDINLQTGQIVGLVWIGTLTLSGCGVNYPASMSMPYDPARGITMVGFSNPQP